MCTTKEQERKAIEKIREIIASIGGIDSYTGKALEGCLELAEENISNDFWLSFKEKAENATANELKYRAEAQEAKEESEKAKTKIERLQAELNDASKLCVEQHDRIMKVINERQDEENRAIEAEEAAAKLKAENTELKAKLYDLMTA